MCQAYDAEWASITAGENQATIEGFGAARKGLPKSANPYIKLSKYDREAWDHGWECWRYGILPWALEKYFAGDRSRIEDARGRFGLTKKLPPELEKLLD